MNEPTAPIVRACQVVGGQLALARLLGVQPPTVNQWCTGKRPVPIARCVPIEQATGGLVGRRDLREDWADHWPELADVKPDATTEPDARMGG